MRNLLSFMLSLNSQSAGHFEFPKYWVLSIKTLPILRSSAFDKRSDQIIPNLYPYATNCHLQVFFSSSPDPNKFFLSTLFSLQHPVKKAEVLTAKAHYCGHSKTALAEVREAVHWKVFP